MKDIKIEDGEIKSFSTPRLDAKERLYVRVYLSTLSHLKAYEAINPGLNKYHNDNPYSRKESIQFHISSALQDKADSIGLSPEVILEKLYKEATLYGAGSNHAARIQALTQLGKHFGLFQDKKETAGHTFNIINYGVDSDITTLENTPPILLEQEVDVTIEGVSLTDYTQ